METEPKIVFRGMEETTLPAMRDVVKAMHRAEERPVYVSDGAEMKQMVGYKSVYNLDARRKDDGKYVSIVTAKYTLVNHAEAFTPFIDAMEREGLKDFQYKTEQTDRYANIVVMIGDEKFKVVPKDGNPLWIGWRLSNGYDGKRCVRYGCWLMRADDDGHPDCSFSVSVPKDDGVAGYVSAPHVGKKEAIIAETQGFIEEASAYGKKVVALIDAAIDTVVDDDDVYWIIRAAGYGPRSTPDVKKVYDAMPDGEKGTIWAVCVAIARASRDYRIEKIGDIGATIDRLLSHTAEVLDDAEEAKIEDEQRRKAKNKV